MFLLGFSFAWGKKVTSCYIKGCHSWEMNMSCHSWEKNRVFDFQSISTYNDDLSDLDVVLVTLPSTSLCDFTVCTC